MSDLARLPKVDRVLDAPALRDGPWRRELAKRATTQAIERLRARVRAEGDGRVAVPDADTLAQQVATQLADWLVPAPRRVINATGVLLHTNLGRAVLSEEAVDAMAAAAGACDLEYDLDSGTRGSRFTRLCPFLAAMVGAEDAHVVNNGAAALLLACTTLSAPGGIAVSRGQLVEIGDGFRVATMAAAGGAKLIEVGSTNRTHVADYAAAIAGDLPGMDRGVSALLWVHLSNFTQDGFVAKVELERLSALAHEHGIPLIADLGSGSLGFGLPAAEPTIAAYLEAGADLVTCSGDKLLGGPQAGVLAGRAELVQRCRRMAMARALRPDKTSLAALHATLAEQALERTPRLPLHRMVAVTPASLHRRALALVSALGWPETSVVEAVATIGGGSLPGDTVPSVAVVVPGGQPSRSASLLRRGATPVIGRVHDERLWIDLRSVLPEEDEELLAMLRLLPSDDEHDDGEHDV